MILLDTCTLLWLAADQERLSPKARRAIEQNAGALYISSITGFEIGVKCRTKKMLLPLPPAKWYAKALKFHGVDEIPVNGAIALHSTELPTLHSDPCDRIIVATAMMNNMPVVTCDELIAAYRINIIW